MSDWQDISTSTPPKDGTVIDLWVPGNWPGGKACRRPNCFWETEWGEPGEWRQQYAEASGDSPLDEEPTHWMPLPPPPPSTERGG